MIFIDRIGDVSIETIRAISISRGIKYIVPLIAFFGIVIWLPVFESIKREQNNTVVSY